MNGREKEAGTRKHQEEASRLKLGVFPIEEAGDMGRRYALPLTCLSRLAISAGAYKALLIYNRL